MKDALVIALGGALGTLGRYGVGAHVARWTAAGGIPWGTFAVNVLGSFAVGAVMTVFALRGELDSRIRLALTIGFLGGFTTYSAFAYETVFLLQHQRIAAAAACGAGIAAARLLRSSLA
jgi:CrcB protein